MEDKKIKKTVREGYAKIANQKSSCCGSTEVCCGNTTSPEEMSKNMGYTEGQLKSVPEGANLGLGCGNPTALISMREGETVLDLGSGAGFDCFLAANKVGKTGKVIGIDMTPEMLKKARENATKGGYNNVEFRQGEIEDLPVNDNSIDVVLSNCVINLSPDKKRVFQEAYRVLKPGGRFAVSDIVLLKALPDFIKDSVEAYVGCISGAILKDNYLKIIHETGFQDVKIVDESLFPIDFMLNDQTVKALIKNKDITPKRLKEIGTIVVSIKVEGKKPK